MYSHVACDVMKERTLYLLKPSSLIWHLMPYLFLLKQGHTNNESNKQRINFRTTALEADPSGLNLILLSIARDCTVDKTQTLFRFLPYAMRHLKCIFT